MARALRVVPAKCHGDSEEGSEPIVRKQGRIPSSQKADRDGEAGNVLLPL